ncbi:MAG: hypothetical protein LBV15_06325, partial [Planctomycetota bacterium]|nr:hypothetical protein [Planctomycetota bacterium]
MAKTICLSRLNPAYLARRHAGTFFLCLALGLLAGTAFRDLIQPIRHRGKAEIRLSLDSTGGRDKLDW